MWRKIMVFLLLWPVTSLSFAQQRCLLELKNGQDEAGLAQLATGRDAARYLKQAVDLLEPVLPPLRQAPAELPLSPQDPDYPTIKFLSERRLLPNNWQPDVLDVTVWQEMLGLLAAWYELEPLVVDRTELINGQLLLDLSELIDRFAMRAKPVVMIASDDKDRNDITFLAIIRNVTAYPRMIVLRPPEFETDLRRNFDPVLRYAETCALPLENYLYAPSSTAKRLFLTTSETRMVIARAEPPAPQDLQYVPKGKELDYLAFLDPAVADYQRYATFFVGPNVGITTIMRIIPQLRTNMNPAEIIAFVQMQ